MTGHSTMAFAANPLSLSVPEAAFEKWLRDSGYVQRLDDLPTSITYPDASPLPLSSACVGPNDGEPHSIPAKGFVFSAFSSFRTLASLLALNPLAKLSPEDFSGPTPSWTLEFVGASAASFSWPAGPSQATMRVQENVRKYVRNYASIGVVVFSCCLYKMPLATFGLMLSLLLWESVWFFSGVWELQKYPGVRQALIGIAHFATVVVLYLCNIHLAVTCTIGITYAVIISHAFSRKLAPSNQSTGVNWHRAMKK